MTEAMVKAEAGELMTRGARLSLPELVEVADYFAHSRLFVDRGDDFETTKAKIIVRIMYGQELGLPAVSACAAVNVINGRPTLGAGAIAAAIMASGKVQYLEIETNDDRCALEWRRAGKKVGVSTFTLGDAKRAGLVKAGGNWTKYPRAMLFARALTEGQRRYCPDLFGGSAYTPDELRSEVVSVSTPSPAPAQVAAPVPLPEPVRVDPMTEARQALIDAVGAAATELSPKKRIFGAVRAKVGGKPSAEMLVTEYAEMAGIVRGHSESGTLAAWCNKMLAPPAEVDAPVEDDDERYRAGTNAALHATWGTYCERAELHPVDSDEYNIMHDVVREWSGLDAGADWTTVSLDAMRRMRKTLEASDGSVAKVALATEWLDSAVARGVPVASF